MDVKRNGAEREAKLDGPIHLNLSSYAATVGL